MLAFLDKIYEQANEELLLLSTLDKEVLSKKSDKSGAIGVGALADKTYKRRDSSV